MNEHRLRPIFITGSNSTISNSNSTYTLQFPSSYSPKDEELALFNLFIYNSVFNMTTAFNNLTCSYTFNGTTYNVTFPPGYYEVSDISNFIQLQMQINGNYLVDQSGNNVYYLSLVDNPVYYAVTLTATPVPTSLPSGWTNPNSITLSGDTPQLNFNTSNFNLLLGFNKSTSYPATPQTSVYQINSVVTPEIDPVYLINVSTNMSSNDGLVNVNEKVIYQFNPESGTFGQQIQIEPQNLLFVDINQTTYTNLVVSFTDQNGLALQINDTDLSLCIVTRKKYKF